MSAYFKDQENLEHQHLSHGVNRSQQRDAIYGNVFLLSGPKMGLMALVIFRKLRLAQSNLIQKLESPGEKR